jgi:arylsulfatase A-like enzyme
MKGPSVIDRTLLWGLLLLLVVGCRVGDEGARPARVLLVSMDTVRGDSVSPEGTPALWEIAEQGVRFERFYAASTYTIPATLSMLTGRDPAEHGVDREDEALSPSIPTLAEILRSAGWRTQAFHEGVYVGGRYGFARGFEEYRGHARHRVVGKALPRILHWIRVASGEPWFLFLQTYNAHYPYGGFARYRAEHPERGLPPDSEIAEWRTRWGNGVGTATTLVDDYTRDLCTLHNQLSLGKGLACGENRLGPGFVDSRHFASDLEAIRTSYASRVREVDMALARIRAELVALGQWEDTLVVVTSDHGEAFFEHGLYRHGYVPFDEVLRVPLVVSWPAGLGTRGRVVRGLTWHLDLVPTVLSLAGLPVPAGLKGRDLSEVLRGGDLPADRSIHPAVLRPPRFPHRPLRRVALKGDHKYVAGHEHFGDEAGLFFDLRADPGEVLNLREREPAAARELGELSVRWEEALAPVAPVGARQRRVRLSESERDALEALGYVDSAAEPDEESASGPPGTASPEPSPDASRQ